MSVRNYNWTVWLWKCNLFFSRCPGGYACPISVHFYSSLTINSHILLLFCYCFSFFNYYCYFYCCCFFISSMLLKDLDLSFNISFWVVLFYSACRRTWIQCGLVLTLRWSGPIPSLVRPGRRSSCPEATFWTRSHSHLCSHRRSNPGHTATHLSLSGVLKLRTHWIKRLIGTRAGCGRKRAKWRIWPTSAGGLEASSAAAASSRGWSWAPVLTLIRRKRTVSLNLSWLLISCTARNLSIFLQDISIHPSICISGIYSACCSGLWCRALTEFRVLINGLTLTQNLIIGDWLSPAFSFFFPSPYRLTEHCDECSSANFRS